VARYNLRWARIVLFLLIALHQGLLTFFRGWFNSLDAAARKPFNETHGDCHSIIAKLQSFMITDALLDKFAWMGSDYVKGPIKGIVLRFPGLGSAGMKSDPDPLDLEWGNAGALSVFAYQDPWGWMNAETQRFVDDVVEAIQKRHKLGPKVPVISTGGSMGGHAALLWAMKSRHPIAACLALFPVCDIPFHYTERPDLPRTFHRAYGSYEDIAEELKKHSPLHQVASMPDIPYLLIHGEKDLAVGKKAHSDKMVKAMRKRKLRVEYMERPNLGHGGPMDYETQRRMIDFVIEHLKR
jgi:pimeloyl-ACP methyl ester carboxylesterase